MAQRAHSAADVTRVAGAFARAMAVERPMSAATDACVGGMMHLAVTPHALLLDGMPLDSGDLAVVECAELLRPADGSLMAG